MKEYKEIKYTSCPHCGYNNKRGRLEKFGTCLRCHKIVDKKIYLRRKLWEAKHHTTVNEEDFYDKFDGESKIFRFY